MSKANTMNRKIWTTSQIVLEGNYLTDAGFYPNDRIVVEVKEGKIEITKLL